MEYNDAKAIGDEISKKVHEEIREAARQHNNLNVQDPSESTYNFVLNCMLLGAGIATVGRKKFTEALLKKSKVP